MQQKVRITFQSLVLDMSLEPRIVKSAVSSEWATKRAESEWGVKNIERIPSNAIFKKYPLIFTKE